MENMDQHRDESTLNTSELQKHYPELSEPTERTKEAIALFQGIAHEAREKGWGIAFLSGLAVDAHFGYLTRQHRDVDLIALQEVIPEITSFLESKGHVISDPGEIKGESLKVDPTDPENNPTWSHGDIHSYFTDEKGNVVIPHRGKELKFAGSMEEITEELSFLGETARFLKLQNLLEEKIGWNEQVGFRGTKENEEKNNKEIEKINFLLRR
jgi:hypothetical protein